MNKHVEAFGEDNVFTDSEDSLNADSDYEAELEAIKSHLPINLRLLES